MSDTKESLTAISSQLLNINITFPRIRKSCSVFVLYNPIVNIRNNSELYFLFTSCGNLQARSNKQNLDVFTLLMLISNICILTTEKRFHDSDIIKSFMNRVIEDNGQEEAFSSTNLMLLSQNYKPFQKVINSHNKCTIEVIRGKTKKSIIS